MSKTPPPKIKCRASFPPFPFHPTCDDFFFQIPFLSARSIFEAADTEDLAVLVMDLVHLGRV